MGGGDRQPRFAVGREHVLVVEVAVNDAAGGGRVGGEVAAQRNRLLDQPMRNRCAARQHSKSRVHCSRYEVSVRN